MIECNCKTSCTTKIFNGTTWLKCHHSHHSLGTHWYDGDHGLWETDEHYTFLQQDFEFDNNGVVLDGEYTDNCTMDIGIEVGKKYPIEYTYKDTAPFRVILEESG